MKLEVGMYARREDDTIFQIRQIDIDLCDEKTKINCKKASHNIIDLIEYWDLLYVDISPDDCGGIVIPMVLSTSAELDSFKKNIKNGRYILKGIVTKKILESYCYMIGD